MVRALHHYRCIRQGLDVAVQEFGSIPVEEHPLYDEKGRLVSTDVPGQDQMTWVAQGPHRGQDA